MLQDSYQKVLPMKYPNREGYFIDSRNHHHICPTHIQRSKHCLPLYSFVHQTKAFCSTRLIGVLVPTFAQLISFVKPPLQTKAELCWSMLDQPWGPLSGNLSGLTNALLCKSLVPNNRLKNKVMSLILVSFCQLSRLEHFS